jgi:hypothetical protein
VTTAKIRAEQAIEAWQCVGCGKLEAPQPCIGVCRDRKVLLVGLNDYEQALEERDGLQQRIDALRALLVRLTRATPRDDGWAASWEQLQRQAQQALDADAARSRR